MSIVAVPAFLAPVPATGRKSTLTALPAVRQLPRPLSTHRTLPRHRCIPQAPPTPPNQITASIDRLPVIERRAHNDASTPLDKISHDVRRESPLRIVVAAIATLATTLLPPRSVSAAPPTNPECSAPTIVLPECHQSMHRHHRPFSSIISPIPVTSTRPRRHASPRTAVITGPNSSTLSNSVDAAKALVHTRVAELRRQIHSLRKAVHFVVQQATSDAHVIDSGEDEHSSHSAVIGDALLLLLTTVIIIPLARRFGISPILGFLAAGVALGPNGFKLIRDVRTSKGLAELGIVFFLFEMGLELSTSKLQSLGADVFGLGTSQFLVTGVIIAVVASMVGISPQAAIVLGASLALSSSAFVLQLLSERGEVGTRFGRAAFGILLFQDLAVVPVLVLTPLLAGSGGAAAVIRAISIASAKAAAALAFIFVIGKYFLRPVFRFVARSKSSEAFIAVILFTVLATSALTQQLGLSDTLGAFLAGVMLAETKFRHQVEADIKPFRGLLLGLFFITVGFSIDMHLAFGKLGTVAAMVSGLLLVKTIVIAVAAVGFGLSVGSAVRTGLLLSQGGEFAYVIYRSATKVGVMPSAMGQLMSLVVALSMGVTPLLAELGRRISSSFEKRRGLIGVRMEDADTADARDFVMVAGWGRVGQSVCEMLDAKLVRYMAFDMSPTRVIDARNKGLPVFFGDARRPEVLRSAGVERARAVVVTVDDPEQALDCVQNIRREFEGVHVFCRARDSRHQKLLQAAGATAIVPELLEASLLLGGAVLLDYGTPIEEVNALIEEAREAHVEELGLSGSITATLASSFKQMVKLDNRVDPVISEESSVSSADDADANGQGEVVVAETAGGSDQNGSPVLAENIDGNADMHSDSARQDLI